MNFSKPFYFVALLFSGFGNTFSGNPFANECSKINCNAGRNSKANTFNGEVVANYQNMEEYLKCGLEGIPFTVNCPSRFSAFLDINNCGTRLILPKKQCPPIVTGKGYVPRNKGHIDVTEIPKGCNEEYKKKYNKAKQDINAGNKSKFCG